MSGYFKENSGNGKFFPAGNSRNFPTAKSNYSAFHQVLYASAAAEAIFTRPCGLIWPYFSNIKFTWPPLQLTLFCLRS